MKKTISAFEYIELLSARCYFLMFAKENPEFYSLVEDFLKRHQSDEDGLDYKRALKGLKTLKPKEKVK